MIDRYSRKELKQIWEDQNRYKIWLDIELAAAEAMEKLGRHSKALQTLNHAVNRLSRNGRRSPDRLPYLIYKLGQRLL